MEIDNSGLLASVPALQVGQNFHVSLEARRTAGEVLTNVVVPFWNGMFCHALEVGVGRTIEAVRVGERFGEIPLGEAEEFFLVKFLSVFLITH